MLDLLTLQTTSPNPDLVTIIFTVVLAFLLSTLIAIVYRKTFRGLSYSRNFVQALILSSIVSATVMHAIGDSLARGLGMLGALAIIRFRTTFKDPKDIIFMFAALAAGIACGVLGFDIALVGTLFFCLIAIVIYHSPFGRESTFDGLLRFSLANDPTARRQLEEALQNGCRLFALVTLRDMSQGERLDYAYHVKLRRKVTKADFLSELSRVESIKGLNLALQESTVEL